MPSVPLNWNWFFRSLSSGRAKRLAAKASGVKIMVVTVKAATATPRMRLECASLMLTCVRFESN